MGDWSQGYAFERTVKMPMPGLIRVGIDNRWLASVDIVEMVSMISGVIAPIVMMPAVAVQLMSIVVSMDMRMISTLMAMIDHGTQRNLHLVSMTGNESARTDDAHLLSGTQFRRLTRHL